MGALPHTEADPPAILIAWCPQALAWRATAVVTEDRAEQRLEGPTTSDGRHAADALQALLDRRFGLLSDVECAPTMVTIAAWPEERQ